MDIKNILNLLFNDNYSLKIKKISSIILFCFYISILQNYSYAVQNIPRNADFLIFPSFGKVVDRYEGTGSEKVIIIQDLHCQPDVQENIKNILYEIKKQYGKGFNFVGIEGTPVSDINIDNFLKIKNYKIKMNIASYFVKKGIISGAELYLIMNPKSVVLRGIEDKYLYLRNFYSLCKSFQYLNDLSAMFNNLINGYNRTRKYFYVKDVSDLDDEKKRYENKEIELEKYLEYLKAKSLKFGINFDKDYESLSHVLYISRYRKNLDIIGIEKEIFLLLDQLSQRIDKKEIDKLNRFRNGGVKYYYALLDILNKKNLDISRNYKKLNDYFRYLDFIRNINDKKIMLEKEDLEFKLRDKILSGKGDFFTFFKSEHDLNILRKYLKNELTSKEIEDYESETNRLIKIKYFSNKLFRKDYFIGREKELIEAESNMKNFYIDAGKRNEVLTNNLLDNSFNKSKVSAIVVGGYHSEGIKNYLKSKGISYEEVIPKGRDFRVKNYYKERLFEQEKWLNKLNKEKFFKLDIEDEKNYRNNFKENTNSLQLISVFADRGLFLDDKNIEGFLIRDKILSLAETKALIKNNLDRKMTSYELFELVINVARNYDGIKGELKYSDLGKNISEILEIGEIREKKDEIVEILNIYDKARKNIETNLNLSAKDKMIAEEAVKLEEKAEMNFLDNIHGNIYLRAVSFLGAVGIRAFTKVEAVKLDEDKTGRVEKKFLEELRKSFQIKVQKIDSKEIGFGIIDGVLKYTTGFMNVLEILDLEENIEDFFKFLIEWETRLLDYVKKLVNENQEEIDEIESYFEDQNGNRDLKYKRKTWIESISRIYYLIEDSLEEWTIDHEQINVDQGDSSLILLKKRKTPFHPWEIEKAILIDAGKKGQGDIVANHLEKILGQNGKKLDAVIISHWDDDHYEGFLNENINQFISKENTHLFVPETAIKKKSNITSVLNKFSAKNRHIGIRDILNIENEIYTPKSLWDFLCPDTKEELERKNIKFDFLALDGTAVSQQDIRTAEDLEEIQELQNEDDSVTNKSSISCFIQNKGTFLLTQGDIGKTLDQTIKKYIKDQNVKKVHIVKINHHSSDHNTNYNENGMDVSGVSHEVAFLSHGNQHGHPVYEVVKAISKVVIDVFSTNKPEWKKEKESIKKLINITDSIYTQMKQNGEYDILYNDESDKKYHDKKYRDVKKEKKEEIIKIKLEKIDSLNDKNRFKIEKDENEQNKRILKYNDKILATITYFYDDNHDKMMTDLTIENNAMIEIFDNGAKYDDVFYQTLYDFEIRPKDIEEIIKKLEWDKIEAIKKRDTYQENQQAKRKPYVQKIKEIESKIAKIKMHLKKIYRVKHQKELEKKLGQKKLKLELELKKLEQKNLEIKKLKIKKLLLKKSELNKSIQNQAIKSFFQTVFNPIESIEQIATKLSGSTDSFDISTSQKSDIEWEYNYQKREVYILADEKYIEKHPYDILSKEGKIYFTPNMAVVWDKLSPLIKNAIMKHEELEILLANHFEAIEADKETGWIINRFNKYILEKENELKIQEFNDLIEQMFNTSREFLTNFSHLGGIKDISILEGGRGLAKPQQIIPTPVKYVWKLVGKVSEGTDRDKADFILKFNQFLGKKGIPVSKFLPNEYGEFLIENQTGEYYALSQFVSDGKVISGKDYTDEQNKNRGILIAQMQNVLINFVYPNREKIQADWLNPNNLDQILSTIKSNKDINPLIASINIEEQADLYRRDFEQLSKFWQFSYIHGDMNPGNIVFDGDRITGLIDFACACYYYRIGEFLRIAIGGSDRSMEQAGYDKEKLKLAIIGYQSEAIEVTRLSEEEIRGIIAIIRFEFIKIARNPEARKSFVNKFFPIYLEDFGTEEKIAQFIDDISRSVSSIETLRVQNFSEITDQSKDSFTFKLPVQNSSTTSMVKSKNQSEELFGEDITQEQISTQIKPGAKLRGFLERRSAIELFGEDIKTVTVDVIENLGVKLQDLTERMNESFNRVLKNKVAKEIEERFDIRDWELEVVERVNSGIMSMDMETQYERVKRSVKIRMSKTLLECLSRLKKVIDQKEYNILLQEIFLHERLEILYRNSYPNKTAQECHDFALNNAGERQKSFVESLKILEEFDQVKIETKLSREELGIIQEKIDFLKGRLKISDQSIYKMYPNIEKCIINNTTAEKYRNRVIVIDINNKEISQILHELNILKIENKVGLNVVLVGEPKNRQRINDLLDYIKSKSNILMEIEWVIGKETCIAIEKGRIEGLGSLLERGQIKIARDMGNGYMLTVLGVVTESLYEKMLIIYNKKSMSSREIASILNTEFYKGKYEGEILREYFRSNLNEASKRINQLILGVGINLQGEAKNMAENIINREIKKEGEIKILQKTEEGIQMSKKFDVAVVIGKNDLLELTDKEVKKMKIIGSEKIELDGISEKDKLFKNMTLYIKREIIKVAVRARIFKFMQIKKDKAIDLNFDTIKSIASAA